MSTNSFHSVFLLWIMVNNREAGISNLLNITVLQSHQWLCHTIIIISLKKNANHKKLQVHCISSIIIIINYFLFIISFSFEEKYIRGYTFPNPCSVFEYATYSSSTDEILSNSSKITELEFK